MARQFLPKIVSANDLFEGDVVYLTRNGGWTRLIEEAAVATSVEDAETLELSARQPLTVIDPYLVDVDFDDTGRPAPVHFRERYRERGPTNRTDLGRQAEYGLVGED